MSAAIGGSTVGAAGSSQPSGFAAIKSEDFVRIMIEELSNQDPFQPQDSSKLLEQMSSLRNIESQIGLQEQLESLVSQNQIASAGGMIGKMVKGLDGQNQRIEGLVTSVRVVDGEAVLELDSGRLLPMDRVTQIASAPAS